MAKRPSHPATDHLAIDLGKIDTEIARLEKLLTQKKSAFDADKRQHALDQNVDLQQRLKGEISDINQLLAKQRERRFKTELGEADTSRPAAKAMRSWDRERPQQPAKKVKRIHTERDASGNLSATVVEEDAPASSASNLPEPDYPHGARKVGDHAKIEAAYVAMRDWHIDQALGLGAKIFRSPDEVITAEMLMTAIGTIAGIEAWFSQRLAEAEERIAELEKRPTPEYKGVWRAAQQYQRGAMVSHDGSVWHCELDTATGLVPGDGTAGWRLAVKRGRDGKDAR
ncbi:hypothetical protein FJ970_18005 [Mesorhizobium sp. B2-1-8]|uniref:hypothetical protein n=1 Tax=Mesorhizobium sp. B2-1-8 TaxID=2589967 RepID=UPI001D12851C|nr:hypothetical protein [Mesorhizobium sp. B2-1-8]UCI17027.1 hypothetical protein FJ970_18005 [Mesorhizobium sp. B2-1-8]